LFAAAPFQVQGCRSAHGAACDRAAEGGAGRRVEWRIGRGLVAYVTPDQFRSVTLQSIGSERWGGAPLPAEPTETESLRASLGPTVVPEGKPTLTLLLVLLAFSGLVGPGGWWVLIKRRQRPVAYLALVFASSLGFSLALLVVDFFQYGLWPRGLLSSLVIIDQTRDRELGISDAVVLSPTGLGGELSAPVAAEVSLAWQRRDFAEAREAVVGDGRQTIARAFDRRTPSLVGTHWLGPAEGRLVVRPEAGGIRVENHLGVHLAELTVWHRGAAYHALDVPRGASRALGEGERADPDRVPSLSAGPLAHRGERLYAALAGGDLGANRYVARAKRKAGLPLIERFEELCEGRHVFAGVYP
jgi:hypothetical protein